MWQIGDAFSLHLLALLSGLTSLWMWLLRSCNKSGTRASSWTHGTGLLGGTHHLFLVVAGSRASYSWLRIARVLRSGEHRAHWMLQRLGMRSRSWTWMQLTKFSSRTFAFTNFTLWCLQPTEMRHSSLAHETSHRSLTTDLGAELGIGTFKTTLPGMLPHCYRPSHARQACPGDGASERLMRTLPIFCQTVSLFQACSMHCTTWRLTCRSMCSVTSTLVSWIEAAERLAVLSWPSPIGRLLWSSRIEGIVYSRLPSMSSKLETFPVLHEKRWGYVYKFLEASWSVCDLLRATWTSVRYAQAASGESHEANAEFCPQAMTQLMEAAC